MWHELHVVLQHCNYVAWVLAKRVAVECISPDKNPRYHHLGMLFQIWEPPGTFHFLMSSKEAKSEPRASKFKMKRTLKIMKSASRMWPPSDICIFRLSVKSKNHASRLPGPSKAASDANLRKTKQTCKKAPTQFPKSCKKPTRIHP